MEVPRPEPHISTMKREDIIETIQYNSDNSIKTTRKMEYKYDAKGNWIKIMTFVNDTFRLPVDLREIEYYE
ncbi:MAG: hypothetical protein U5L72_01670 [Bacteroidales bacterium]|nr:hypothetical protein [Bacteroidales bacterium]